jgi:mutator protein MutT
MPHFDIAIALLWCENRVLVTQRRADAEHLPGVWEFPGGKCESGETPAACAIREAREEIGVEISIVAARPPLRYEYSARRVTLHPFDCVIVRGQPQPLECAAWRWLAPAALRDEEFPAANAPLLAALRATTGRRA